MEWVYQIKVNDVVRYIGRTNDLKRRLYEHKRGFRLENKKELYDKLRELQLGEEVIILEPIKSFRKKTDAKRWECFLILQDYFNEERKLWQKVPRIAD
jgi:predicted GIY-YIG superfamily endonuclease